MNNVRDVYKYPIPEDIQIEIANRNKQAVQQHTPQNTQQNTQQNMPNSDNNSSKRDLSNRPSSRPGRHIGRIRALLLAGIIAGGVFSVGYGAYQIHKEHVKKIHSADIQTDIKGDVYNKAISNISIDDLVFDGQGFNVSLHCDRINVYTLLANTDVDEELIEYFANPTDEAKSNLAKRKNDIANLNFNLIKASLADSLKCTINDITITYTDTVLRIHTPKGYLEYWSDAGKHNDTQISSEDARTIRHVAEAYVEAKSEQPNLSIDEVIEQHANLKHILGEYNYTIDNDVLCFQGIEDGKLYKHSEGILRHSFTKIKEDKEPEL